MVDKGYVVIQGASLVELGEAVKRPLFSILTSTYNAGAAISIAAASVRVQHRNDVEYIIIDGASTDDTLEHVERNRDVITHVISESDSGIYDALNKGIAAASGTLIGIIGCDDSFVPGALDAVARAHRSKPADIYAGQTLLTDANGVGVLRVDEEYGPGALISGIPFGHNSMFASRAAYDEVGLYDTSYRIAADANWVHRAILKGLTFTPIRRVLTQFASTGISSNDSTGILAESGRAIRDNFPFLTQEEAVDLLYGVRAWTGPAAMIDILRRHSDPRLLASLRDAIKPFPEILAEVESALDSPDASAVFNKAHDGVALEAIPASGRPLVSFIVPAYNVAGYIGRCIESLTEQQSLQDVEVIVVDDGSTDDTAEIVKRYQVRDRRIRLIQQDNAGQGAARAAGLAIASGKYIWCVDSDDRIQPRSLERITNIFNEFDVDVVVLNFAYEEENGDLKYATLIPAWIAGHVVEPSLDEKTFAAISPWACPPWRFFVKREALIGNNVTFHPGFFYEDHPFAIDILTSSKNAYIDTSISYYYLKRSGSTVRSFDRRAFDFLIARRHVLDKLANANLLEQFPSVASSYVFPIEFIKAHVGKEYLCEFLERLWNDTNAHELKIVRNFGGQSERILLDAGIAGHITTVDLAQLQSSFSKIGQQLAISRTFTQGDITGLSWAEGPYPEIGLPAVFHWVSGRALNILIRKNDHENPHLFLRYRNTLADQYLLVEQNNQLIEMFPCRETSIAMSCVLEVKLLKDDVVNVTIEMRQCDASPRALSLLIERLEIIDGSYADDPSFNGSELPTPQKVIKGDRTRLENFHVDVRRDQQKRTYVRIGDECLIGGTVVFERGLGSLTIGNRTSIGGGSLLICTQPDGISIGSNVMLSWNVTLIDSNSHSLDPDIRANDAFDWLVGLETGRLGLYKDWSSVKSAPIVIKDNAWIGFGSSIMKGVTIGEGAVIGANSVVTKDVPDGAIVAGNPAKIIGTVPGRLGQPISQG